MAFTETVAVFFARYSITDSPSIINLLSLLAEHMQVDVYIHSLTLKVTPLWSHPNIRLIDLSTGEYSNRDPRARDAYDNYITIDPYGFELCKKLYPKSEPTYFSLELYLAEDTEVLSRNAEVMKFEREHMSSTKGLIIQSQEKADLFISEFNLPQDIPIFLMPVTYKSPANPVRTNYIREKYDIAENVNIALHLGGIANSYSCLENALAFANINNWVLFFHGFPNTDYLAMMKETFKARGVSNIIFSNEFFEHIEDIDWVLSSSDLGVAWYNDISENHRTAGHSSGKISAYMRFGLPIITKKYRSTLEAIQSTGVGECVEDHSGIPHAVQLIESDYRRYAVNSLNQYQKTYWFENYKKPLLKFVSSSSQSNAELKRKSVIDIADCVRGMGSDSTVQSFANKDKATPTKFYCMP